MRNILKNIIISVGVLLLLFFLCCFTDCFDSCINCSVGCESEEGTYSLAGISCKTGDCTKSDSYLYSCGEINYQIEEDKEKVKIVACDNVATDCSGESGCYNGIYVGGDNCENFGIIIGSRDDYSVDEKTYGCINGSTTCGNSYGVWNDLFESIYYFLGLGE